MEDTLGCEIRLGVSYSSQVRPLSMTFKAGRTVVIEHLLPPAEQDYLFSNVTILNCIACHLATTTSRDGRIRSGVVWAFPVVVNFCPLCSRFGGIEPHFKDYKSAAFQVLQSSLRDAQAPTCLFMLLDSASLLSLILGMMLVQVGEQTRLNWHGQRGLSFPQLGLRDSNCCCYQRLCLPKFQALTKHSPLTACASHRKRNVLSCRIKFSGLATFSYRDCLKLLHP